MPNEPALTHTPPSAPPGLTSVLARNMEALRARREDKARQASREEKVAAAITKFSGSMRFVYLHAVLYGAWIALNLGAVPGLKPFDPTFVVLGMIASVEAIFLSTFILISQNRMGALQDERAELDVQVNLLAEHEITKILAVVTALAAKLDVAVEDADEMAELKKDVSPEAVLEEIEESREAEDA